MERISNNLESIVELFLGLQLMQYKKPKEKAMYLNKDNVYIHTANFNNKIVSEALSNQTHKPVGHITISVNAKTNSWMISEWFVDHTYQHQGIGKELFQKSIEFMNSHFPYPNKIKYVWNGANQYVYDWLQKNFSPVSQCPMAIQKFNADDDWLSHVYELDKKSLYDYFGVHEEYDFAR